MKILVLGEIIGRIGRQAVLKVLPEMEKEYGPDLVLANADNLAHGKGVTLKTIQEILFCGVDFFTSGDHFWSKKEELEKICSSSLPIIRPANYPATFLGQGYKIFRVNGHEVLIINLMGRVYIKEEGLLCPFVSFDQILSQVQGFGIKIVLVDFHAEATAEKIAFAYYVNGRASLVFGTHTHVATADERILSAGTGLITDIGMVGARDSVIGFSAEGSIKKNLGDESIALTVPERGLAVINGIFVEINERNGKTKQIKRIQEETKIV